MTEPSRTSLQCRFSIRYLPGKRNCAADFLSRYLDLKAPPDGVDEEHDEDMTRAMAAATVAALDLSEHLTLDEEMVLQASLEDPSYQLLVAKVLASDWHPHGSQEITCLRPYYDVRHGLGVSGDLVTYA